jgi:hypothetical protein
MDQIIEPLSDHPFFRALVLMGGGLALSCGGIAEGSGSSASAAGAPTSAAGGSAGTTTIVIGVPSSGGALSVAGAPSVTTPQPECPYAQWDCSSIEPSCYFSLSSATDPVASKCFCNTKRPVTADDCGADETLVCLSAGWQDGRLPGTWDNSVHVQCSCVRSPVGPNSCGTVCSEAFPTEIGLAGEEQIFGCSLPPNMICDANGVCTASSADVLRQDGIMCGCAYIGLK